MSFLCSPGTQGALFWNTLCIHRADTSISLFLMLAGVYVASSGVGLDTKISSPKTGCRNCHFWRCQSAPESGMWPFMPLRHSVTEPGLKDRGALPLLGRQSARATLAPADFTSLPFNSAHFLCDVHKCVLGTDGAPTTDQRKDSS